MNEECRGNIKSRRHEEDHLSASPRLRVPASSLLLRPLAGSDVAEYGEMLHASFNAWYWKHGWGKDYFVCKPQEASIFYDIYNDLTPGSSVAAFDADSGRMAGACFYHPRPCHVSLGIMCVHRDYGGQGVGRSMVDFVLRFTREHGYPCCRLVGSAVNMDSFSLYNRSGFVPRCAFHDMVLSANDDRLGDARVSGEDRVRDAALADVAAMGDLEMDLSAIRRDIDYRYAIENPRKVLHASVYENDQRAIDGFTISVRHPALNMIGPCVARSEETAIALVRKELERFRGAAALLLVPMEKRTMVEKLYQWGAVNVETHLQQVWGDFQPCRGVNMPGFLPETG
jgi:GNAT superfamily N-acetyltransferase